MQTRARAAELYVKALRTGEASATTQAARFLAPDVALDTTGAHMWGNGHEEFSGYDDVLHMITGIGVMTEERWKQLADFMITVGLIKATTDWRSGYTTEFVKDLRITL